MLVVAMCCLGAASAAAQGNERREGAPDASMVARTHVDRPEPTIAERAVPDYDGRAEAPPSVGRRLLWIPRLLFLPAWLVTELVLRRPLAAISRRVAKHDAGRRDPDGPLRYFVFHEGRIQIIPTLLIDFGNQPSAGFYFRWNEAGHPNHHLRFHFGFWGPDWVKGRFTTRWEAPHERLRAELRVAAQRRGDGRFAGLGSAIDLTRLARFSYRQIEVKGTFEAEPWRQSFFQVAAGVLEEVYGDDAFCCTSIEERVAEGVFAQLPPGYPDGFLIAHLDTDLTVDTRRDRGEGSSGVSVRFRSRYAVDLQDPDQRRWIRYGGALGLHWDVSGAAHILSLVASAQLVSAIRGEVPFTQRVELSGPGALRGFRIGALMGDSGAALTFRYQWPIWMWLDAEAHVGLGNVYDGVFEGFALDQQRMSFGVGVGAIDNVDHHFHFTLAWGTEPIASGFQVQSFRLAVSAEWDL